MGWSIYFALTSILLHAVHSMPLHDLEQVRDSQIRDKTHSADIASLQTAEKALRRSVSQINTRDNDQDHQHDHDHGDHGDHDHGDHDHAFRTRSADIASFQAAERALRSSVSQINTRDNNQDHQHDHDHGDHGDHDHDHDHGDHDHAIRTRSADIAALLTAERALRSSVSQFNTRDNDQDHQHDHDHGDHDHGDHDHALRTRSADIAALLTAERALRSSVSQFNTRDNDQGHQHDGDHGDHDDHSEDDDGMGIHGMHEDMGIQDGMELEIPATEFIRMINEINMRLYSIADNINKLYASDEQLRKKVKYIEQALGLNFTEASQIPSTTSVVPEQLDEDRSPIEIVHELLSEAVGKIDAAQEVMDEEKLQIVTTTEVAIQEEILTAQAGVYEATAPPESDQIQQELQGAPQSGPSTTQIFPESSGNEIQGQGPQDNVAQGAQTGNDQEPQETGTESQVDNWNIVAEAIYTQEPTVQGQDEVVPEVTVPPQQQEEQVDVQSQNIQTQEATIVSLSNQQDGQQSESQASPTPEADTDQNTRLVDDVDVLGYSRYSFRGYNPFADGRRDELLRHLRVALSHRQVQDSQGSAALREGVPLDQDGYRSRDAQGV